jgi:hypothetical protein
MSNAEAERYWGLLERRLALLAALSQTLADSRADFISLDLEGIRGRIAEQQRFCGQIRALDQDITAAQVRCARLAGVPCVSDAIRWPDAAALEPALAARLQETLRRVAAAQSQLQQLNNAHQALLRRSQRTVQVLVNLFQSHAPTYAAPMGPASGNLCEERV